MHKEEVMPQTNPSLQRLGFYPCKQLQGVSQPQAYCFSEIKEERHVLEICLQVGLSPVI